MWHIPPGTPCIYIYIYIYICVCVCVCVRAEHRGNVRNLVLLNCASRLRRTQPYAAATYRQIHETLPVAISGNDNGDYMQLRTRASCLSDLKILYNLLSFNWGGGGLITYYFE